MDTAHSEMPTVLMPIKANFAEAILNGTKKWELRRRAPRIETPFRVMLVVSGTDGQLWGSRRKRPEPSSTSAVSL